ncbi:MAG: sugar phosphate isomerase/epimerase family protein [Anaerolineae bacterium]
MLLSISTATLYGTSPGRFCAMAAEAGFDGIELVVGPRTPLRRAAHVAEQARRRGLAVLSVHESLAAGRLRRRSPAALLAEAVETALRAGAPRVVVHPPGTYAWEHPHAVGWLEALLRARDTHGAEVMLCVENAGHYVAGDRQRVLARLPDQVMFCRQHSLRMTLDTCHVGTTGQPLMEAWQLAGDLVGNLHLSDLRVAEPMVGSGLHRKLAHEHRFPGEGDLPLEEFLAAVRRQGYQGPVTTEVSIVGLGGWRPATWSTRLAELAAWARHATERRPPETCEPLSVKTE